MLNHGNMICALPRHNVVLQVPSPRRGPRSTGSNRHKINSTVPFIFYPRRTVEYDGPNVNRTKTKTKNLYNIGNNGINANFVL